MRYLLIYVLLFSPSFGFSNQWATLNCLSVQSNGDVTISWSAVTDDCSSFVSYEIYTSSSYSGSYTLIQTITNNAIETYTHSGTSSNLNSNYYYIKTESACGSFLSDTLNTIFLDVTATSQSTPQLNWNSIHTPVITNNNSYYYIYKNSILIDSVGIGTQQFDEYIYNCAAKFISYNIGLKNNTGCISLSNSDSSEFTDIIPPNPVVTDTVSVFPGSGKTIISWSKSNSPDVFGYIIYMANDVNASSWTQIDTIYGADNTTYIFNSSDASEHPEYYRIAPMDTCEKPSPMNEIHGTMYVFPYYDDCLASMKLEWNYYTGWTDPVSQYKIYCKIDNEPEIFLGAVSGTVRQFVHTNIIGNTSYCYYIRAVSSNGTKTSTSNLTCRTTDASGNPSLLNADYATVDSYNNIKLSFTIDAESEIKYLKLMKSESIDGTYNQIAKLNKTSTKLSYTDYADIMHNVYYYKTIAINKCDVGIKESNIANNIVLNVKNTSNLKHELSWNSYEDWLGDISYFNIYRTIDDAPALLIYQQYYGIYTYTDDLSEIDLNGKSGKFCYYIEAVEGDFNPYGIKGKSKSNIACAEQFPRVFVANAFTPNFDDVNDVITPLVLFASPKDYVFQIYNRWGEVIFTTNKPSEGWNGNNTLTRKKCATGTYVYYIYFTTAENEVFEQSGNITLYSP